MTNTLHSLHSLLSTPPFRLDAAGVAWVEQQLQTLTLREKIGQLFILQSMGQDPGEAQRLQQLAPAGITRFFTPDLAWEAAFMDGVRQQARLPLLVSADLEGSRMSLPFGTEVPNPLALAAVDDVTATQAISHIMAHEAVAMGINWSFSPVVDIAADPRSAIVPTRGLGSDVPRIIRHAQVQIETFQAAGIAATAKHWPGEGFDSRDQHLVTTINPLSMAEWQSHYGQIYRSMIDAGVLSIMSAHIALPAYVHAHQPEAGVQAYRPASVSALLNQQLLRTELGFNGVIVSDATGMAGLGSFGPRAQLLPQIIANGCDLILFSDNPEADYATIEAAIADGRISSERLHQAIARTLGLKAALGLHRQAPSPVNRQALGSAQHQATARAITARAPTLVKDVQGFLPLSTQRQRRLYVYSTGIISPIHQPSEFALIDMLRHEGFEVTVHNPGTASPKPWREHDAVLYLMGEESLLTRERIFMNWARLTGHFVQAMERPWHEKPSALVSFGHPFYLMDAPRMPCVINAYATMDSMQEAVLACLLGRAPFQGQSPVDAFIGSPDTRY